MIRNYLNVIAVILGFFVFSSCSNDNDGSTVNPNKKETTVEEDKQNLKESFDSFYTCLSKIKDGGFADFFYDLTFMKYEYVTDTIYGDGYQIIESYDKIIKDAYLNKLGDRFSKQFGNLVKSNKFDYEGLKGKYEWNAATNIWDKSPSKIIELKFPSNEKETQNNSKLIIDSYEDFLVSFKDNKPFLPVKAHLLIEVNGEKTFELNVSDVVYDVDTNISIPTNANIKIFTKPYTSKLALRRNTTKSFNLNYKLTSPDNCGYEINADVDLNSDDYGNLSQKDFNLIKGFVSHNKMKFTFNLDIDKVNKIGKVLGKLTENELNSVLDAQILYDNVKISDVTLDKSKEKIPAFFTFKDGSKEDAYNFIGEFEQKIRDMFKKFEYIK